MVSSCSSAPRKVGHSESLNVLSISVMHNASHRRVCLPPSNLGNGSAFHWWGSEGAERVACKLVPKSFWSERPCSYHPRAYHLHRPRCCAGGDPEQRCQPPWVLLSSAVELKSHLWFILISKFLLLKSLLPPSGRDLMKTAYSSTWIKNCQFILNSYCAPNL